MKHTWMDLHVKWLTSRALSAGGLEFKFWKGQIWYNYRVSMSLSG